MSHLNLVGIEEIDEDNTEELSPGRKKLLQTYQMEKEKENLENMQSIKFSNKIDQRINTLHQPDIKTEIINQKSNIGNNIQDQWKKIKCYEHFIIEIIFQLGLIDRLVDNFQQVIETAYQKHCNLKIQKKQKKQEQVNLKQIAPVPEKNPQHNYNSKNQTSLLNKISTQRKRVTMVGQIQTLTNPEISLFHQNLTQQHKFKKYCFNKFKVQNIYASFSKNYKFFNYKVQGKSNQTVEPVSELVEVIIGRVTKNFKKYLKKGEQPEDNISFSLVFSKRTYDLSAQTAQMRTKFISGIAELMSNPDFKK